MILCGTDFSSCAGDAALVAAGLARLKGTSLALAFAGEGSPDTARSLASAAAPLRELCPVEPVIVDAPAESTLLELATARGADLLVVGGVGHRPELLRLGSTAEHLCQAARLPVLVVRDAAPLQAWASGARPLRLAVLVDEAAPARAVVGWVAGLAALGAVEVALIHLAWPPAEQARLGLDAPMDLVAPHPDVLAARKAELEGLASEAGLTVQVVVRVGWGRPADHLVSIVSELGVELVVLGTRPRGALDRLWRGSVTHGVLRDATCSVAAVPTSVG